MKQNRWIFLLTGLAAMTALACVTINVYFPEAAVKELATQIEDAVEQQAAEGGEENLPPSEGQNSWNGDSSNSNSRSPHSRNLGSPSGDLQEGASPIVGSIRSLLALAFSAPKVYAEEDGAEVASPEISNPAIRKIIANRAKRAPEVRRHKASGVLGETNDAILEIRSRDALSLKDRAAVQKLVKAENSDRETMFKEIAAATGTDLSQLPQIRTTYAETLRAKAKVGDWIQLPDDSWVQKK